MDFKLQEGRSSLVKVVEERGERLLWDVRRGSSCAGQAEDKEKAVRKQRTRGRCLELQGVVSQMLPRMWK